ncbi:MAG TPA: DUF2304 domain-containing protein [Candidatus Saccharimonadales bacterium]|nr:DUF2304 domain-containing protein [Candidatus Saccharimonadales bacterium]
MTIKVVLLTLVAFTCVYFMSATNRTKTQAWKKILFTLFVLFMVVAIVLPDTTTRAANWVGVGRGADLLLYILSLAFVFFAITTYSKFQQERNRTFALARKLAIYEARLRQQLKDAESATRRR